MKIIKIVSGEAYKSAEDFLSKYIYYYDGKLKHCGGETVYQRTDKNVFVTAKKENLEFIINSNDEKEECFLERVLGMDFSDNEIRRKINLIFSPISTKVQYGGELGGLD
ncbi:MAG: hypothetical protein Q8Q04_00620 [archaeon]|nr:hypothetical protein [archaeon]